MRTLTPTRPRDAHIVSFKGERGNRTLATTFTVSDAATTPNSPSHSGRGGIRTPRAAQARAFSKRVRPSRIRVSSNRRMKDEGRRMNKDGHRFFLIHPSSFILLPCSTVPARTRTWTSSFASSCDHPFHHEDEAFSSCFTHHISRFVSHCPRQDSNPERSVRSAA